MKATIVFIINSIQNPRCIKRVNEFVDNGYDVKVYAFNRRDVVQVFNNDIRFEINVLDTFSNDWSYIKRLPTLFKNIKSVVHTHKNSIFYLFGLETAMIFKLLAFKQKYIYEESDLVHTYLSNSFLKQVYENIDKFIIRKSIITVFTSEGFVKYHFGERKPENCHIIPNRLSPEIKQCELTPKVKSDQLRIGFVGHIRFKAVKSFAEILCSNYPNCEFHFYGNIVSEKINSMFAPLKTYSNCYFHGAFKTPFDLPKIYSKLDLVLSTYDTEFDNVRYAEPNKIYESIYFETPIIVSDSCYLGEKVKNLNIGFTVNALDSENIKQLIDSLTLDEINSKIESIRSLGKDYAINNNEQFFQKLSTLI